MHPSEVLEELHVGLYQACIQSVEHFQTFLTVTLSHLGPNGVGDNVRDAVCRIARSIESWKRSMGVAEFCRMWDEAVEAIAEPQMPLSTMIGNLVGTLHEDDRPSFLAASKVKLRKEGAAKNNYSLLDAPAVSVKHTRNMDLDDAEGPAPKRLRIEEAAPIAPADDDLVLEANDWWAVRFNNCDSFKAFILELAAISMEECTFRITKSPAFSGMVISIFDKTKTVYIKSQLTCDVVATDAAWVHTDSGNRYIDFTIFTGTLISIAKRNTGKQSRVELRRGSQVARGQPSMSDSIRIDVYGTGDSDASQFRTWIVRCLDVADQREEIGDIEYENVIDVNAAAMREAVRSTVDLGSKYIEFSIYQPPDMSIGRYFKVSAAGDNGGSFEFKFVSAHGNGSMQDPACMSSGVHPHGSVATLFSTATCLYSHRFHVRIIDAFSSIVSGTHIRMFMGNNSPLMMSQSLGDDMSYIRFVVGYVNDDDSEQ